MKTFYVMYSKFLGVDPFVQSYLSNPTEKFQPFGKP